MSVIVLEDAKNFLNVFHDADDEKLQMLLDGAEAEALNFMNRTTFTELCECDSSSESSSSEGEVDPLPIAPDVTVGCFLMLQASYQASPSDALELRNLAEIKLMPYRCGLGV